MATITVILAVPFLRSVDYPLIIAVGALISTGTTYLLLWKRRRSVPTTTLRPFVIVTCILSIGAMTLSAMLAPGEWIDRAVYGFLAIATACAAVIPLFGLRVALSGWRESWTEMQAWHPVERIGSVGMALLLLAAIWGVLLLIGALPLEHLPFWAKPIVRELLWIVVAGLCWLMLAVRGVLGSMMRWLMLSGCLAIMVAAEAGLFWALSQQIALTYLIACTALVMCNFYAVAELWKGRRAEIDNWIRRNADAHTQPSTHNRGPKHKW